MEIKTNDYTVKCNITVQPNMAISRYLLNVTYNKVINIFIHTLEWLRFVSRLFSLGILYNDILWVKRIILDVGTREGNPLAMLSNYSEQRREYIGVGIDLRGRSTIDPRVSENHILRCPSTLFQCEGNLS